MTLHDLYLLSPELSVAGVAILVLLFDLATSRKGYIAALAALGLIVPLAFTIVLWIDMDQSGYSEMRGVFNTMVVDKFSLFFKMLFIGAAALVVLMSTEYVSKFRRFQGEYYALILFSVSGMMLLASTLEMITIYISLELTALPIAALAAFLRDGRSTEAGMKFLILSAVSSAVLLYGMVMVYGFTGTTSLPEIADRMQAIGLSTGEPFGSYALLFGVVLIVAGFGFKIAAFPFQMWAPDVYEGAPTPVTAFLSVASKAAGFAIILRFFYLAFSLEALSIDWSALFAVLSAASMSLGNLVAIQQNNVKRLLAYSTVAHAGYLMVGLAAVSTRAPVDSALGGPSGVLFYLGGYAATNLAVFAAIIAMTVRTGGEQIDDLRGMGRRAPFLAAALAFGLVSLIGVPPTVGFMAKVYIFGAAVNAELHWLVIVGVINTAVSAYYYLRIVKAMYLEEAEDESHVRTGLPSGVAIVAAVSAVLFFGVYPTPLIEAAKNAVNVLLIVV